MPRELTFATGNEGKLAEARDKLGPLGFEVTQYAGGYPEVQADELETVARHGMDALADELEGPFLLEDAGLFVDALDGFPGVYSSYVYGTLGNAGLLRLLADAGARTARFRSVVGYHDGRPRVFEGVVQGRITRQRRGEGGFGFDPVFSPEGRERTFAEMSREEKSELSHRGRALEALAEALAD